ncbi:PPC domain-containing DNA-binding protein [Microbacterium schleiferi]|uniref:PPC domain-containing DNA-binding protein n=1 Tax=Microbacterium schleiferi TaxID=69362 RepID=UPI00311F7FF7
MRSAEITTGRQWMLVLDPGEELLETITAWCVSAGVTQATVSLFGAFRSVRLIGTNAPLADEEPPLADAVDIAYLEGVGSGTITSVGGTPRPHIHVAAGVKSQGSTAYAGHLLRGEVHYTVEVTVIEVISPTFVLRHDTEAFGLTSLHFTTP